MGPSHLYFNNARGDLDACLSLRGLCRATLPALVTNRLNGVFMFIISHVPHSHTVNRVSLHFTKEDMEGQRWEMIDLRSHSQLVAELSSHQVF